MRALTMSWTATRRAKLVKLDIMLNGDVVDALSFILHEDKAYPRCVENGRKAEGENSASAL